MKLLLFGSTGMLGRSIIREASLLGYKLVTASRANADLYVNFVDPRTIEEVLDSVEPDVIINAAAIIDLAECEKNPGLAYMINASAVGHMAEYARKHDKYLVQISTDHYYQGDADALHAECQSVSLVNEYARTKYTGECFALTAPKSLVIRTNIVGFKNKESKPTFVEWALKAIQSDEKMNLFEDFYTSSLTASQLSEVLLDLIAKKATGIYNVAAKGVCSKKNFVLALADKFKLDIGEFETCSVHMNARFQRAESLGLDVAKAEHFLGYLMPEINQVIDRLYSDYQEVKGLEI